MLLFLCKRINRDLISPLLPVDQEILISEPNVWYLQEFGFIVEYPLLLSGGEAEEMALVCAYEIPKSLSLWLRRLKNKYLLI